VPQELRIGPYTVYFWSNESDPLEPIHVHVAEGRAIPNATKIWITRKGKTLLCNKNSKIPDRVIRRIILNSLPACDYTLTTLGNFSKNIENRINLSL